MDLSATEVTVDLLEQQLLISQAQRKSPVLAAILGFFFPWAGAFYNGKIAAGVVFLVIDLVFFLLSIIGIGLILLLLYGFFGAFQNYRWAQETNQKALSQLIQERKTARESENQVL